MDDWTKAHDRIAVAWEKVLTAIEWDKVMDRSQFSQPMRSSPHGQLSVSMAEPTVSFPVAMDIEEIVGRTDKDIEKLLCQRLRDGLVSLQAMINGYLKGEGK